jgi:exonuclease VII large subunit
MWTWLKDNGTALIALATILTAVLTSNNAIHHRLNDIRTDVNQRFDAQDKRLDDLKADINQRFDAQDKYMNQRFDIQGKRLDGLTDEVSQVHRLSDRIARNDMRLDTVEQQLQTADAPAP